MLPLRRAWVTQPTGGMPGDWTGTVGSDGSGRAFREHRARAPETDIRLDEAAFCIAACARPDAQPRLDVDEWCGRIDALAAASSEPTFEGVRTLLFVTEGFRGNADDYGDPRTRSSTRSSSAGAASRSPCRCC